MSDLRILSLGAGVQSSTLALMIEKGEIPMVDAGIFADTQAESKETYEFLNWLKSKLSYPIYIISKGNLTEQLVNSKFPIAPFFIKNKITGKNGILMRQCTNDYKIRPITVKVRELLGLEKGQKIKKGIKVEMLMGISKDEVYRMKPNRLPYITNVYPLIDMNMRRQNCIDWFNKYYDKTPPRSACTYCPFHSDKDFENIKKKDPEEWKKIVLLDRKIRNNNRDDNVENFIHRSRKPIDEVNFNEKDNQLDLFNSECEGYCGN